ncbi:MAG: hypothetical protein RR202_05460 [Bacteroidales bacterium]
MESKVLSSIEVSTELFHIDPLQHYIGYLADYCRIPDNKRFHLSILIEEVFAHIVSEAFQNKPDGKITVSVGLDQANFALRFHYLGIPYGYSWDSANDMESQISNTLIRKLSSSYKMNQRGKDGQTVEINIALPPQVIDQIPIGKEDKREQPERVELAKDAVELREIRDNEMKMFVQCLYNVFGYTYSADGVYYPEVILERKQAGVYKGFVAVNSKDVVVAHVGMLKDAPHACICECGQAFVVPEYGKRGLFHELKNMLILDAERSGLRGVTSSAVTGHPFTQKVNIHLNCIETGMELAYIPSYLKSVIGRDGETQRQSIMLYFYPTTHQQELEVYIPSEHREIISETYRRLGLPRVLIDEVEEAFVPEEEKSEIEMEVKTEWNQVHINILTPGKDLSHRVGNLIRQGLVCGASVMYVALPLTKKETPAIVKLLEERGFFYAGITPYQINGEDAIKLQYLVDLSLDPRFVIAESEWGALLKDYVFACKEKISKKIIYD